MFLNLDFLLTESENFPPIFFVILTSKKNTLKTLPYDIRLFLEMYFYFIEITRRKSRNYFLIFKRKIVCSHLISSSSIIGNCDFFSRLTLSLSLNLLYSFFKVSHHYVSFRSMLCCFFWRRIFCQVFM